MISVFDSLARVAAERTLNSVITGMVLTVLVWALFRLSPRINARSRVIVSLSVLLCVPALSLAAILSRSNPSPVSASSSWIVLPEEWASGILVVWLVIATFALLRVAYGVRRVRGIRSESEILDLSALNPEVRRAIDRFRPHRPVTLLRSESARVPMAVGFVKPAIVIPTWALDELSPSELSGIFIHEFAHLSRWDDWTNFFQKVVGAIFFFHPAVWWLDRRLALDREIACDDVVLDATQDARSYARSLIDVAEKSLVRRGLALAQAAVHRVHDLSLRVSGILDASRPRSTRTSKLTVGSVAVLSAASLVVVLHSPTLIAFQNTASVASQAATVSPALKKQFAGAKLLNASLQEATTAQMGTRQTNLVAKTGTRAAHRGRSLQPVVKIGEQPRLVRADLSSHRARVVPVETMLVVTRQEMLDPAGGVSWTFSVWRLTVFHPAPSAVQEGNIAKKI